MAEDNGTIVGLYILHPNNVGRCGHIANASYAVDSACRGKHIGEKLVSDCLVQAKKCGFRLLQFNAVVENNIHARGGNTAYRTAVAFQTADGVGGGTWQAVACARKT